MPLKRQVCASWKVIADFIASTRTWMTSSMIRVRFGRFLPLEAARSLHNVPTGERGAQVAPERPGTGGPWHRKLRARQSTICPGNGHTLLSRFPGTPEAKGRRGAERVAPVSHAVAPAQGEEGCLFRQVLLLHVPRGMGFYSGLSGLGCACNVSCVEALNFTAWSAWNHIVGLWCSLCDADMGGKKNDEGVFRVLAPGAAKPPACTQASARSCEEKSCLRHTHSRPRAHAASVPTAHETLL